MGRRRWLAAVALAAGTAGLYFCYLRVSQTYPGDSYGGIFTLQARDMLHGNVLLHGWSVSDVSFYPTELPEYMLVVLFRGLSPDVVHIAGAATFTLLLLLAALLAKGRATGGRAVTAALITAAIMGSPQAGGGVFLLLLAPDHLGTCVPVLLAWLVLDRWPARWYVPVTVGTLLAWALVADQVVLLTGVLPLVAVCGIRAGRAVIRCRQPWRSRRREAALIGAGLAAVLAAELVQRALRAAGGFSVHPVRLTLTSLTALPGHLLVVAQGILLLFGADVAGQRPWPAAALILLHLAGVALAAWATCRAVRRFNRIGLVPQILVAAVLINLAALLPWGSLTGTPVSAAREIIAVLPFGAVLAGRLLARPLLARPLLAEPLPVQPLLARGSPVRVALAVVLAGYLASLAIVATGPVRPPQYQLLTNWLVAHRFRYGLGWAPLSGVVTASGQVTLAPVVPAGRALAPGRWESDAAWFDATRHSATFLVQYGRPPQPAAGAVLAAFGPPRRVYRFAGYVVMSWDENLLAGLSLRRPGTRPGMVP